MTATPAQTFADADLMSATLAEILADADRMTPEQLAEIITDADWYGDGNDNNTAIGNYIAMHLWIGTGKLPEVWVQHHTVIVLDLHTRVILAESTLTGGAAELHELIDEDAEGFGHLHDPYAVEFQRDRATDPGAPEIVTAAFADYTNDDDPEFFTALTTWRAEIAA